MKKTIVMADSAGVFGAVFAALCCAGLPLIVSVLALSGLSFIRNDSILIPLMGISLAVALWGFILGRRIHGSAGPLRLAIVAAVSLVAGVLYVHGLPARVLIGLGTLGLLTATGWNIALRRNCARGTRPLRKPSTSRATL